MWWQKLVLGGEMSDMILRRLERKRETAWQLASGSVIESLVSATGCFK